MKIIPSAKICANLRNLRIKNLRQLLLSVPLLLAAPFSHSQTSLNLGEIITIVDNPDKVEKVITSDEIKNSSAKDLPELLKQKGMLVMSSGGAGTSSNFSCKGYAGFCCKVYVDGVLATQPGTGEFDWNSIDINSIESITVSEIPDTATDQFAGAVVKITTRLVSERGFDIKTLVTSYENSVADTVSLSGEYRDVIGSTGFKLNAQVNKADNNYETPAIEGSGKKSGDTLENNWSNLVNVSGSFNSLLADSFTLSGTAKVFRNQVKAFNTGSSRKTGLEDDLNFFGTVKGRYVTSKSSIFSASATEQFSSIVYSQSETKKDITKMNQADLLLTAEDFFGFEASSIFSLETKITGTQENRFHNTTKIAWNSRWHEDWLCIIPSAGILTSSNGNFELLPQLTVSSRRTGFSFSAFRQFILPTFNQLYWEGSSGTGNPDLKPEEGWELVSAWKSPFTFLPVSVIYTYGKYKNKIRWTSTSGTLRPENTVGATYKTLEVTASKSWKHLDLSAGVTNTKALLKDGCQIMWVPEWQYNAAATVHAAQFDFCITLNYTGRRPQDNADIYWYDPFTDLGASVSWHFVSQATVSVSAANLLDQRRYYHDSYPMPSRSVTVGFLYRN